MANTTFDYPLGLRPWRKERHAPAARLREGYTFSLLEHSSDAYRFSAVAGAGKVTDIFRSYAGVLPEEAFLILEFYQDEADEPDASTQKERSRPTVYYSPYLPVEEILEILEPYFPRLVHDGFVGFGLANNRAGMELFYSEEKILTSFTGNHIRIMDLFARHGLAYDPRVLFPTDFGHDHLSLLCHPRRSLPAPFASMTEDELDYVHFCSELTDLLDMYPVEETLSFFLSEKEQNHIETRLRENPEFADYAEDDFGSLLLDWDDFVTECEGSFEGDLWEYRQGLKIRDAIQYVVEGVPHLLQEKILEIVAEADAKFQKILVDRRKRLDHPDDPAGGEERFWYRGVIGNQGVDLRRDLIRHGWYRP